MRWRSLVARLAGVDERTRRYAARLDALNARPLREQVEDDVAAYRGLSPEERAKTVERVLRAAWQILRSRPDFERAVRLRDPPAPDFDRIWSALLQKRQEQRGGRGADSGHQ